MQSLIDKYRPMSLDDLYGQAPVLKQLRAFADNPYPCSFLFSGEPGIGKTSAGLALANELSAEVIEIEAGNLTVDSVNETFTFLKARSGPFWGQSWAVLTCDECDGASPKAMERLCRLLEPLPARTVAVFTTNNPEKLSKRFRDERCRHFAFSSCPIALRPVLKLFAQRVWHSEGKPGEPSIEGLGVPPVGKGEAQRVSFRYALQQLQSACA